MLFTPLLGCSAQCNEICAECFDIGEYNCTSCNEGFVLTSTNTCECGEDFEFEDNQCFCPAGHQINPQGTGCDETELFD